jgi:Ca2+-binding RTX toxin-like protein
LFFGVVYMAVITGTNNGETLNGTEQNDSIFGRAGNDYVLGLGGNDSIFGEQDNDTVYGEDGDDRIFGGDGNDTLNGGKGNNLIYGGDGNDIVSGGLNITNTFATGNGKDTIFGGNGNDTLSGSYSDDYLLGESGDDRLLGGTGNDKLIGRDGNDTLNGATGLTYFESGSGGGSNEIDLLTGGSGKDTFSLIGDVRYDGSIVSYRSAGNNDYALITDFNKSEDVISLTKNAGTPYLNITAEYSLGASPSGLPQGTGIFAQISNRPDAQPELIAVVQNVSPDSLSLTDSYFSIT